MTRPDSELRPITLTAAALALLCAVLWGGVAVAVRFTQEGIPPVGTAGLRFAIASIVLWLWTRSQRLPLALRAGQVSSVIILGLILFLQIGSFHWGVDRTTSAHASVLIGAYPIFVALIAHFTLVGDRLDWQKSLGLAMCLAGLVAVVSGEHVAQGTDPSGGASDRATLLGDAVVIVSSILLGAKLTYTKAALARVEVAKLLVWSSLLATVLFLLYSAAFEGLDTYRFDAAVIWGLLYQGVVIAGFCFLVWTLLLRRHRASELAVFGFAQPLCGLAFGVWLRNDPFSWWLGVGGIAVAAGIYLVARGDARKQR